MKKNNKRLTFILLIIICASLSIYRMSNVIEKETSWDVLGYYIHLPAVFIYNDPLLDDPSWLVKVNEERDLTGTLYQISSNDEGEPMYFFLMGMSLFFLPFFLLGHGFASLTSFPMDGFSLPYQYALVFGGIIYTIIGLIFLRKILKHFFSEAITAIILIIVVFGTNYIHHLTLKNLETVNVLFMLTAILIWNTIRWHEKPATKNLMAIGVSIILMALIKPSEVLAIFVFLLWNIASVDDAKKKINLLLKNWKSILTVIIVCLVIALPQISYWLIKTGKPLYDSYKNPGVGLDFLSPHIMNALFSYRKGWLIYTPVMIFSLIGFYFLFKYNRKIFLAVTIQFLISFYIVTSWTEWWYGAGFSNRPLITSYPFLSITLGYFLVWLQKQKVVAKVAFALIVMLCIFFNQFQWWQLKHWILDPYSTTKEYYWATFLKTTVTEKDKEYLLVSRDKRGENRFNNDDGKYHRILLVEKDFNEVIDEDILKDGDGNSFFRIPPDVNFTLTEQFKFNDLTNKDHIWVIVSLDIRYPPDFEGQLPCLVTTMERSNGSYNYLAHEIKFEHDTGQWHRYTHDYLTPELRSRDDVVKCYLWKRGQSSIDIDNFKLEIYEKK